MYKNNRNAGIGLIEALSWIAAIIIVAVLVIRHMNASDARAIQSVMRQDKDLGEMLNSRMRDQNPQTKEDFDRVAEYYDAFVDQAQRVDTHDCPREFAEAYSRYVAAFREEAEVYHSYPHQPSAGDAFEQGFNGGREGDPMRGVRKVFEADDALREWQGKRQEKTDNANRAEQEMKAVAARLGET